MSSKMPFEHKLSVTESKVISEEIIKLLDKGVISKSVATGNDFFSSLFVRLKKDSINYRTILNLKSLNTECDTHHFKKLSQLNK
jgi:hypothetical protein